MVVRVLLILFLTLPAGAIYASAQAGDLPVETLTIRTAEADIPFTVELAATPESRSQGLMFREYLAWDTGMLFDFHQPRPVGFWMKNTPLSLDILFIRNDGTIAGIHPFAEPYSEDVIESPEPVRAVLELRGGATERFGLAVGQRIAHRIFPE